MEYLIEYTKKVLQFRHAWVEANSEEVAKKLFASDEWDEYSVLSDEAGADEPLIINKVSQV